MNFLLKDFILNVLFSFAVLNPFSAFVLSVFPVTFLMLNVGVLNVGVVRSFGSFMFITASVLILFIETIWFPSIFF